MPGTHAAHARASFATISMSMLLVATIAGCAADAVGAPEASLRLIVRFKPGVLDPLDPAFLARLASQARVTRIDAIRAMSGDAYVLQVACGDPGAPQGKDPCESALARLRAADPVRDIDVDRREKHQ